MKLLIYISEAADTVCEDYLKDLLDEARTNNAKEDITGMLIYKDGQFMQALEGEDLRVEKLFKRISLDKNHSNVTVLSRKEIFDRSFADWSMGFKSMNDKELVELEGFQNLHDTSFFSENFRQSDTAYNLLSMFTK